MAAEYCVGAIMMPKLPESDLQILLEEEPDRSLASLEADIWAALSRYSHARRVFRAVFATQAAVLAAALIGSALVGFYTVPVSRPGELDIFSIRPALAASTLLAKAEPLADRELAAREP